MMKTSDRPTRKRLSLPPFRLFLRFHLVPFAYELVDAIRRKPWFFVAVAAIAGVLALRPGAAPDGGLSGPWRVLVDVVGPTLGVFVLSWPLRSLASQRRTFYSARPGGPLALAWYAFFRLLFSGAAVSMSLWWLLGLPNLDVLVASVLVAVGACALLARVQTAASSSARDPGRRRALRVPGLVGVPGPLAFVLSHPAFFFGPFVAVLGIFAWAVAGGGGFVWADHPPVAGLLSDFLWPTLFGLVWADVARVVPYGYFRMARAPVSRILVVLGLPVLVQTLVVLLLVSLTSASASDAWRAWVLNLAGVAFWFFFGLRWGPATLLTFAFAWAVLVAGLVVDRDWWAAWAGMLAVGSVAGFAGWKAMVAEGWAGEEEQERG